MAGTADIKWEKPIEQLIKQDILGKDIMTFAAKTAKKIMNDFVPMDTGNLSNDENAADIRNKVEIMAGETLAVVVYTASYAAFAYYNNRSVKFKKIHHSKATAHWDRHSMNAGGKEKLVGAVSEYIKSKRKKGG